MEILHNERIDLVNDRLSLIQKTDGLTFGTDALLLAGFIGTGYKNALELGSGSGIISMLVLTRGKALHVDALEVQDEYALLTNRNAELNSLQNSLSAFNIDLREYTADSQYDLIFSNPPYMKASSGKANKESKKNVARHEIKGGIFDFLECAKRNLKYGGDFYCVYRPDRMIDLVFAMRECGIEPKRLCPVYANTNSKPSMILVEGRMGGKPSLKYTKPFIIYKDEENKEYTSDMAFLMEAGMFPPEYK